MKQYDFEDSPILSSITQEIRFLLLQAVHALFERLARPFRPLPSEELNLAASARAERLHSETTWSSRPTSVTRSSRLCHQTLSSYAVPTAEICAKFYPVPFQFPRLIVERTLVKTVEAVDSTLSTAREFNLPIFVPRLADLGRRCGAVGNCVS